MSKREYLSVTEDEEGVRATLQSKVHISKEGPKLVLGCKGDTTGGGSVKYLYMFISEVAGTYRWVRLYRQPET